MFLYCFYTIKNRAEHFVRLLGTDTVLQGDRHTDTDAYTETDSKDSLQEDTYSDTLKKKTESPVLSQAGL